MPMREAAFTPEDLEYFRRQTAQARLAEPVIQRDYAALADTEGAWVAFVDGHLIARAPTADDLAQALAERGHEWQAAFVRYLPGKDTVLVY